MRAIKRLIGGILLLALLAGAAYGYVWYSTKTYLDQQIVAASSVGQVSYHKLRIDPRGEIRVDGIQIIPAGYRTPVDVDSVSVRSDDPLFFLDPQGRLERGEYPEFLSIAFDGAKLDPQADFITALQPSQADLLLHLREPQLEALGCGEDILAFTPEIWGRMGIGRLSSDIAITLRADNDQGRLDLFTETDTAGIGAVSADLSMTFAAGYLKPATVAGANPRLKSLEVNYRDTGYYAKRDRFCAGNAAVDEAQYRANHLELVKQRAAGLGMQVPEILWLAYADSNAKGADVRFGMNPVGGLGAEVMMGLNAPTELIERLRLHLEINGRPVDLNQVDWLALMPDPEAIMQPQRALAGATEPDDAGNDQSSGDGAEESVTETSGTVAAAGQGGSDMEGSEEVAMVEFPGMAPKPLPTPEVKFRRTEFDDLQNYIYSDIRIFTYYGNRVEGRLEAVEGDNIKILHRVGKGLAIYPVDRAKLEVIEVMR